MMSEDRALSRIHLRKHTAVKQENWHVLLKLMLHMQIQVSSKAPISKCRVRRLKGHAIVRLMLESFLCSCLVHQHALEIKASHE